MYMIDDVYSHKNILMIKSRQFKVYTHKFKLPLETAYGIWSTKESIILREENISGKITFGEISLTPHFYPYTILDLLPLVDRWTHFKSFSDNELFSSAISCLDSEIWGYQFENDNKDVVFSAEIINSDFPIDASIFKKKIGIKSVIEEIEEVKFLLGKYHSNIEFRLDANESLTSEELLMWNQTFKDEQRLQFIEQPLPRDQYLEMLNLQDVLSIKLSIDESLVFVNDLSFFKDKGWKGYYTIKPSMFRDWEHIISFIKSNPDHCIISTSFESPFGYEATCRCAKLSNLVGGLDRKLFKNSKHEFLEHHKRAMIPGSVTLKMLNKLWNEL